MVALDKQINIRFTDNEHRRIKSAAALNGETLQTAVRRLLVAYADDTENMLPTYEQRQRAAGREAGDERAN